MPAGSWRLGKPEIIGSQRPVLAGIVAVGGEPGERALDPRLGEPFGLKPALLGPDEVALGQTELEDGAARRA